MMAGFMDLPTEIRAEIYRYLPPVGWNSRIRTVKGFSGCSNTFRMNVMRINRKIYQELRDEMFKHLEWSFRIDIRLGQVDELRTILIKALADIRKQRDFSQALVCSIILIFDERKFRCGEIVGWTHDIESLIRRTVTKQDILRHWLAWFGKARWIMMPFYEHPRVALSLRIPPEWLTSTYLPNGSLTRYVERWAKWAPKRAETRPPWRIPPGRTITKP